MPSMARWDDQSQLETGSIRLRPSWKISRLDALSFLKHRYCVYWGRFECKCTVFSLSDRLKVWKSRRHICRHIRFYFHCRLISIRLYLEWIWRNGQFRCDKLHLHQANNCLWDWSFAKAKFAQFFFTDSWDESGFLLRWFHSLHVVLSIWSSWVGSPEHTISW